MRHRLLHTLVLSSSFLLDACATVHAPSDAGDAAPSDGSTIDPRLCEPGWPTTKAQFTVMVGEVTYGCRHLEGNTPESPDLSLCCVVPEAP